MGAARPCGAAPRARRRFPTTTAAARGSTPSQTNPLHPWSFYGDNRQIGHCVKTLTVTKLSACPERVALVAGCVRRSRGPYAAEVDDLPGRLEALDRRLTDLGSVLVAFSAGADSALLLAAACRTLGADRVAAATAVSSSLAEGELEEAQAFADSLGVRLLRPRTHEIRREGYRANDGDRCFHCKAELLDTLGPLAAGLGLAHVATGTNADDAVAGFRPGIRAAAERGAVTPLLDAGLTKAQVREASRIWGLPTWDKPAAACLSSRVAFGVRITPGHLVRVDRAERAVRSVLDGVGLRARDLRVRDLGDDRARIEVDPDLAGALLGDRDDAGGAVRTAVVEEGFTVAEIDPRGFRSGSMNELLSTPEVFR